MSHELIGAVQGELLVRHLDRWLPVALQKARRATVALAFAGADTGVAEAVLGVVAGVGGRLRGRRLAVVVLSGVVDDLPTRLGALAAGLPAEVAVHPVPGGPDRLPVALRAAGAAGAPSLTYLDAGTGPAPAPAVLAALGGRSSEALVTLGPDARRGPGVGGPDVGSVLGAADLPLVGQVELVPSDDSAAYLVVFGTGSARSLTAVRDDLWAVTGSTGLRLRNPVDPTGQTLDSSAEPNLDPLCRELLTELRRSASGTRTVTELRHFTLTRTAHRSVDVDRALAVLLDSVAVRRAPAQGRFGGDVVIGPVG